MLSYNVSVMYFVHLLILLVQATEALELGPPALEFNKHRLVQPIVHHGRTKREILLTRDTTGAHHTEVTVTVPIDGQEYVLDLRLNQDLVTDNHILSYQKNGKTVLLKPKKEEVDLCQYSGTVRDKPGSWVAVSTCHGVRGIVFDGERMRYIEPAEGSDIQSNHYVYDHSDLNTAHRCGNVERVTHNASLHEYHDDEGMESSRGSRYKRYAADNTKIRGPYNGNKQSKYVELVLVADNREYIANGRNLHKVYRKMKDIANIINSIYSPLKIFIALVGVEVWTESDKIVLEKNAGLTLSNFLKYRESVLLKDIPNDNAHLLTHQKFTKYNVGMGYFHTICSQQFSGGIASHFSKVIGLLAAAIAHEMGHNFGMKHDDYKLCKCPHSKCIMNPGITDVMPKYWSSCSSDALAVSFEKGLYSCLENRPERLFSSPTCGNGFTEPGEQCDCGTAADARAYNPCTACCNPDTCMLRANASCGAGMCCDLQTCRPKSAGTVCRSADRECDLPEYCVGYSEYCPEDVHKMDTTPCGNHGDICFNQRCVPLKTLTQNNASMTTLACLGCSGHGVCNSAGHCHCDLGFAPPLCAQPGSGGSYDSGPATNPYRTVTLEFNKHRLVQPIVHHGRTKREITTTRQTGGAHHSEVTVTVPIDGQEYVLDLRLNQDLVTDNHVLSYQKNGETVLLKPKKEEVDLCQYSGTVRGKPGSWVAVSTCHGVRGTVFDGERMRYIEPAEGSAHIQSDHYIYDHSDLNTAHRCGNVERVTHNASLHEYHDDEGTESSRGSRYKRYAADNTKVRGPYNGNKKSKYVELVLVADNREYIANGRDLYKVYRKMKDIANIINSMYSPLNIFIALVGVVVWTESDKIILEGNADRTLNNFLTYRKSVLVRDIPNDNAHLFTRQKFTNSIIGKAFVGAICSHQKSGGIASHHSEVIGLLAATMAHEMGHNFGMEHDNDKLCKCPGAKCIMSSMSTMVTPTHWSSCSLEALTVSFGKGLDYCLKNRPERLFSSPTCGNGFTEPGEQCDCGTAADARAYNPCTACCNPDTCMLRANASCGAGMCCDLQTCRPKSAGTVCRSADRECDLPEYCTGHSEYCPDDFHKMDTTRCGKNGDKAYCVRGSCRSHNDQCRLLWGPAGVSSHHRCYTISNVKGSDQGNCGYTDRGQSVRYVPCAARDAMCGTLHCRHLNERLQFGMDATMKTSYIQINNVEIVPCQMAIIDLGRSDVDPGLVPDGAECGDEMMCLSQRCVHVKDVRERIASMESSVCPSNCSGHGICNSAGHCHCEPGFAPPLCALPGPGGSYDSGPATDPTILNKFMMAMYVIFLGIVPAISLVLFLIYASRHNALWWKKTCKSRRLLLTLRPVLEAYAATCRLLQPGAVNDVVKNTLDSLTDDFTHNKMIYDRHDVQATYERSRYWVLETASVWRVAAV